MTRTGTVNANETVRIEGATIEQQILAGERAAFMARGARFLNSTFKDGESPLKHAQDITLEGTSFEWKYPLWYAKDVRMKGGTIFEMGRAGIWYADSVLLEDAVVEAPKEFRRCQNVSLLNVHFSNAQETLWNCDGVRMKNVYARGDYFAMGSSNITAEGLTLSGNYPFDGARNVEVRGSNLVSKDAFWNAQDVTIYDSRISGQYFGWNSRNITLVNCTVESEQGFCYMENLVMKNCTLLNTNLAFEYSTVDVEVVGRIDSVKNPRSGVIRAKEIGTLILDEDKVDASKTRVVVGGNGHGV